MVSRSEKSKRKLSAAIIAAGVSLILGSTFCWGGDRVVFSVPTNSINTPESALKERRVLPGSESTIISRMPAPVEAPPVEVNQSGAVPSKALQELIDRHRNWVFLTPETAFVKSPDLNDSPGESLSTSTRPPSRAMETYIENQNRSSPSEPFDNNANARRSLSVVGPQLSGPDYRPDVNRSSALDIALSQPPVDNQASPLDRLRDGQSSSGSVLSPLVYPNTSKVSTSSSQNPSSAGINPARRMVTPLDYGINMLPDLNTESLQPVVGRNPADSYRQNGSGGVLDLAPTASRAERRGDALTQQILGSSTLAPAIAAPTENRLMRPMPAVLEVPKRKF